MTSLVEEPFSLRVSRVSLDSDGQRSLVPCDTSFECDGSHGGALFIFSNLCFSTGVAISNNSRFGCSLINNVCGRTCWSLNSIDEAVVRV